MPAGKEKIHLLFGKPLYFTDSIQLVNGLEEIFIEEMYRQQLPSNPYIIDCGANIGLSVIYMKMQYPQERLDLDIYRIILPLIFHWEEAWPPTYSWQP